MTPTRCPRCGSPTCLGPLEGQCPRCLAELAFTPTDPAPSDRNPPAPDRFADYELLRELGRGGMGVVYEARQRSLKRRVALKMLLGGSWARPESRQRFQTEALAAARLRHPGIVAVYDVGEIEGQPFLALELVDGPSLAELVRNQPLPPSRAARFVQKTADAVAHAHALGILHRDLKPSNILIDREDNPRITDFGLAREQDGETGLTRTGEVVGTPAYLAPECLTGHAAACASDIYSLGAILYELVTGRPPFVADHLAALVAQVARTEPLAPRLLNPAVPRDLETICLKCLQKSPHRRYSSAADLAADLERHLSGRPIQARPVSRLEKLGLAARRNPALATVSVAFAAALLVGTASVLVQWRRAESNRADLARHLYAADVAAAGMSWREGNMARARALLARHPPSGNPPPEFTWRLLSTRARSGERLTLGDHPGVVTMVAVSPDGHWAASGSQAAEGPPEASLRLWDLSTTNTPPTSLPITNTVWSVAFADHGKTLISAGADGLRVWDLATRRAREDLPPLPAQEAAAAGTQVVLSANHPFFDASAPHPLQLLDLSQPKPRIELLPIRGRHPALSPDGRRLVILGPNADVQLHELPSGRLLATLATNDLMFRFRFSHDGRFVAGAGQVTAARLWDLEASRQPARRFPSPHNVWDAAFSPDATTLITATSHQHLEVWEVGSGVRQRSMHGHDSEIWSIAPTPDGTHLVSGGKDHTVRLWSLLPPSPTASVPLDRQHPIRLSPRGSRLLAFAQTNGVGTTTLWEWGSPPRSTASPSHPFRAVATYPGKVEAFTQDGSRLLRLISQPVPALEFLASNPDEPRPVQVVALQPIPAPLRDGNAVIAPDGRTLVCPDTTGTFHRWSTSDGRLLGRWSPPQSAGFRVRSLAVSSTGRWLALGPFGSASLTLLDWTSGTTVNLRGHRGDIATLAFSPDERVLASGSIDGTVRLWNLPGGSPAGELAGHLESIEGIAISPDAQTLAAVAPGIEVVFWHLPTLRELTRIPHPEVGRQLAFAPDGSRLFLGATDGHEGTRSDRLEVWEATEKTP